LSPILFNLYLDDLARVIQSLTTGIDIGTDSPVSILLYADDIVRLSASDEDIQCMLDVVSVWCKTHTMQVNVCKTFISGLYRLNGVPTASCVLVSS
jgi:hypothetical protein